MSWLAATDGGAPAGYRVMIGNKSRQYSRSVDVGNVTRASIPNVDTSRKTFIAVIAYNQWGDSLPSNETVVGKPAAVKNVKATELIEP